MKRKKPLRRLTPIEAPKAPTDALQAALDRVSAHLERSPPLAMTRAKLLDALTANAQMIRSGVAVSGCFERIAALAASGLAEQIAAEEAFKRRPFPVTHAQASAQALEGTENE